MFEKARFKLTAWYLVIIMGISILFSFVIYSGVNSEFMRFERMQKRIRENVYQEILPNRLPRQSLLDPMVVSEARMRVITTLAGINLGILMVAGMAGYFLAGRTLKPIKKMVDEQNRFITDASHELRTPLTSLRSEIEVELRNKNATLEQTRNLLKSNLEEVINLKSLSDGLLELAQNGHANTNLLAQDFSLAESILNAIKKIEGSAKAKKILIEKNIENITLQGIPDRLTQCFVILLDNAVKYSPQKSIISIIAKKERNTIVISFTDQGMGIDKKDIPYIFDRFYRANKSRSKNKISGYGLGLSIAKKIIDSQKGMISVESEVEKGSTFKIVLPL